MTEVAVVVPTRDRADLLARTLHTILWQRDVDLEVIVVDDGSVDGTAERVAALGDTRVRVLRNDSSGGVSRARNAGAAVATAPWVAFCDDDDLWAPTKLRAQLTAAADADAVWAYGGAVKIDLGNAVLGGSPPPSADELVARIGTWNVMPGGSSNVVVRSHGFEEAGGFDPSLKNLADWDLWIRLAQLGRPACVDEPLVGYRIHGGNASGDTGLVVAEARRLDGRYGARIDRGELHHYLAWVSLRSGRRGSALRHFAAAARHGAAGPVLRSTWPLVRRRVSRRVPTPSLDERRWRAAAATWLAEAPA